jgi:hypothetical protein
MTLANFLEALAALLSVFVPGLLLLARWLSSRIRKVADAYGEERAKLTAQFRSLGYEPLVLAAQASA